MNSHAFTLKSGYRGVPPGTGAISSQDIASCNWSPARGEMALPLLSLNQGVLKENISTMMAIVAHFGITIAPHGKTPMSPALASLLVDAGAIGTSVADLRQAEVMLEGGLNRILLANQIGGQSAVNRLVQLLQHYPDTHLQLFVDAPEFIDHLERWYTEVPSLPAIELLIEIGCGRGGVTSEAAFSALVQRINAVQDDRIILKGIAFYEGTCMRDDITVTEQNLTELFSRVDRCLDILQSNMDGNHSITLSAGGSSLFDYVIEHFNQVRVNHPDTRLMLRSGACFFSDHGNIHDRLMRIAKRGKLGEEMSARIVNAFKPALRLWAEVISKSSDGMAICGLGMRDSSIDQGLPVPIRLWRDGAIVAGLEASSQTMKLNDQHSFVSVKDVEFKVGDVIEFGIRHPCTCIDKHNIIYSLDANSVVVGAFETFFG